MLSDTIEIYDEHTAGTKLIGFDYQIFYFLYLSLDLNPGEELGFEIYDDIHVKYPNGNLELIQLKHTIQKNTSGEKINLTERDIDLWKTISNWISFINASGNIQDYIKKTSFTIITNKSINSNIFLNKISCFKNGKITIKELDEYLLELYSGTDGKIKDKIHSLVKLPKKSKKNFLNKFNVISDKENIISKIKKQIYKLIRREERVKDVFNSFCANIMVDKFLTISDRGNFKITFEDFSKKYKSCFDLAFSSNNLPIRQLSLIYPDDLKEQIFIKQLIEIGETDEDEEESIRDYTTAMLKFFNQIKDWVNEGDLLETDKTNLDRDAILVWKRIFKEKYREIKADLSKGISVEELENKIKKSAIECVDTMRKERMSVKDNELTEEYSNGLFYLLSNEPLIGWHWDWEKKYK